MVVVSPLSTPYLPDLVPCDFFPFPGTNRDLNGRCSANVAEVQKESLSDLDSIYFEEFSQCLQQRQRCWDCRIQSQGWYCDRD